LLLAAMVLALLAAPAHAENPVLSAEGDADVMAALAEATQVQGVCYGYLLHVRDEDTGRYDGDFSVWSVEGVPAGQFLYRSPRCPAGVVVLEASLVYTSAYSEAEDGATWGLISNLPGLTSSDLDELGLDASDLTRDDRSETTLLNAVLSLPRLASEQAGRPPVLLEPNTAALPPDARPTNTPGSDWLRENGVLLGLCIALVLAGLTVLALSRRPSRRPE
jgi:hypothetical protein